MAKLSSVNKNERRKKLVERTKPKLEKHLELLITSVPNKPKA